MKDKLDHLAFIKALIGFSEVILETIEKNGGNHHEISDTITDSFEVGFVEGHTWTFTVPQRAVGISPRA